MQLVKKMFVFVVVCLSCASVYGKDDISNTKWKVQAINDQIVPKHVTVEIFFQSPDDTNKGKISGLSGCNHFMGAYFTGEQVDSSTVLGFTQLSSTKAACLEPEASRIEKSFFDNISFTHSFFRKKDKLYFQSIDHKIIMVLIPSKE